MSGHDQYVDPSGEAFEAFRQRPLEQPVEMLNLVRFRKWAAYPADHPPTGQRISGAEAYRSYSIETAPIFAGIGGTIIWSAAPELTLIGPPDECWDAAFIARYPSAEAFLAMISREDYRRALVHRRAAVETSRLIRTSPSR